MGKLTRYCDAGMLTPDAHVAFQELDAYIKDH